jgi:hypothetical protein
MPLLVLMQAFCPSGVLAPLWLQVQFSPAKAGRANSEKPMIKIERTMYT